MPVSTHTHINHTNIIVIPLVSVNIMKPQGPLLIWKNHLLSFLWDQGLYLVHHQTDQSFL